MKSARNAYEKTRRRLNEISCRYFLKISAEAKQNPRRMIAENLDVGGMKSAQDGCRKYRRVLNENHAGRLPKISAYAE